MIEIENLRRYFAEDVVFVTAHAGERFRQRGIKIADIRSAIDIGRIIEQYPEDFPYPSCLVLGLSRDKKAIHVVMSDEGSSSRIITAYYPDVAKWSENFSVRKAGV